MRINKVNYVQTFWYKIERFLMKAANITTQNDKYEQLFVTKKVKHFLHSLKKFSFAINGCSICCSHKEVSIYIINFGQKLLRSSLIWNSILIKSMVPV